MRIRTPCAKKKCFNGKGGMIYGTVAQYATYQALVKAAVQAVRIRARWGIPLPFSVHCSIGPKYTGDRLRGHGMQCPSAQLSAKIEQKNKTKTHTHNATLSGRLDQVIVEPQLGEFNLFSATPFSKDKGLRDC